MELDTALVEPGVPVVLGLRNDSGLSWHRCQVTRRDHDRVWIQTPRVEMANAAPVAGEVVVLDTWRPADARYSFRARVFDVEPDALELIGLQLIDGQRIQRREYFRVPVSLVPEEALVFQPEQQPRRPLELLIRDLSASGIRAHCTELLRSDEELWIKVLLPDGPLPIDMHVRVTRVVEHDDRSRYACEVGAALVDPAPALRERLIRYTLHEQREQRRRGML
jgi:c-di-GMP-binding flagellar brake protein YcgR